MVDFTRVVIGDGISYQAMVRLSQTPVAQSVLLVGVQVAPVLVALVRVQGGNRCSPMSFRILHQLLLGVGEIGVT